jgi:hypothetical protein
VGDLGELERHLARWHGIRFDPGDDDRTIEAMRFFHMEDHTHSSPMGEMPLDHRHQAPL